ncbi:MAG: A/G-specific adenine glycosylase [Chitinophagaceae bacterium]|nr:MAG: A/G-specific adenine glycosylase [Chitinophagaceae bacterium]
MPWKGEKDPYRIWLSEIILQQTRVEQGTAYFQQFVTRFPTIHDLAKAPDDEVFKLWEGLGYYSRCRNLIQTARFISEQLSGVFPTTLEGLKQLKGVGGYTAAAIGSFAFELPYAVVDGNVLRVLTRVFGVAEPIDQRLGREKLDKLAQELIDISHPGLYNQAIMDFGATVCKPKQPICSDCPFAGRCIALKENKQSFYPLKSPKKASRKRWFYYLVLEHADGFYVRQRTQKDIWQDLYEFILIESEQVQSEVEIRQPSYWGLTKKEFPAIKLNVSDEMIHVLSHQRIHCRFVHQVVKSTILLEGYHWVSRNQFDQLPFPRMITRYLESKIQ